MTFRKFSKRATVGSLFLGVVLAGSVAFAAWTANGGGNGYAKATTAGAVSTNVIAAGAANLYPGASNQPLYIEIHNPNPFPVTVTAVTGNGSILSGNGTCDTSNGVSFTDKTGLSISVAANSNTNTTIANSVSMSNASVDACQGLTFTIPVSIAATS
jgi:hypothetical protein